MIILSRAGYLIKLYSSFFQHASAGFILFDENLNLIDINNSILRILRIKKKDFIKKNIKSFSPYFNTPYFQASVLKTLKTGRSFDLKNITSDSSTGMRKLDIHVFKAETGIGIVITDITKYSNLIKELNQLLYKLSHDLRSPNSAIRGLVQVAQLDKKDELTFLKYLGLINREATKLDKILTDLSRTVKVGKNKVINQIFFNVFVKDVLILVSSFPDFDKLNIQVKNYSVKPFFSNKFALDCIFQILIENSVKYRNKKIAKSKLLITIKDENKGINVSVKDNGIGIDKDALSHIFEIFYRGTSTSNGSGLGLFTLKNCVRELHGKIKVESEVNVGTSFSIYIPSMVNKKIENQHGNIA